MEGQIYSLIGQAMNDIDPISKDSYNQQQKFKYRGIDAVMNALNPVMRKYGLFLTPEVLNHQREERQTQNGGRLIYSILTMRYTMYAPDGSSVSAIVIGEGMDSGDKASNKAMSVAMKYAMFQLFCIPTEEFIDPDSETPPESTPIRKEDSKPKEALAKPPKFQPAYDAKETIKAFCDQQQITMRDFTAFYNAVVEAGIVPRISSDVMTEEQCNDLLRAITLNYLTEKKNDRASA